MVAALALAQSLLPSRQTNFACIFHSCSLSTQTSLFSKNASITDTVSCIMHFICFYTGFLLHTTYKIQTETVRNLNDKASENPLYFALGIFFCWEQFCFFLLSTSLCPPLLSLNSRPSFSSMCCSTREIALRVQAFCLVYNSETEKPHPSYRTQLP